MSEKKCAKCIIFSVKFESISEYHNDIRQETDELKEQDFEF